MAALRFLFSPSGRLPPQPFIFAVIAVYLAGSASHWLTTPDVIARAGLWPFVAVQALLIFIWYALHARRMHDAGRGALLAVGIASLYVLSLVLLIIVAASFFNTAGDVSDPNAAGALGLLLLASIIATLIGSPHYDVSWAIVAVLVAIAVLPLAVAILFSLWAALQPSAPRRA
jgi:uncharacterized membrane protein YhaH (DUF805 family)